MAWDYDVSADGRQIVLDAADPAGQRALWLVLLERESSPSGSPTVTVADSRNSCRTATSFSGASKVPPMLSIGFSRTGRESRNRTVC
jgi:hypothetical protein